MSAAYTRLNQAVAKCKETLLGPDGWYDACMRVSNILTSMGRFNEASQWHSMAVETEPNPTQFHAKVAVLYVIQEEWDEAINWYSQLLEINPQYAEAHRNLAQIYSRLGDTDNEVIHWYEFLSHKPELGTPEGHVKLGDSLQEQGKFEQAAICYERAIVAKDQYWQAYDALAELRSKQKRWNDVADCYQRMLEQDPSKVEVHYNLGKVWLQQKHYDRAIAKFREINTLDPTFSQAYQSLVQCLVEREQWDDVVSTCRSATNSIEDLPWAYRQMGRALAQKGEEKEAIAAYQQVFQLHGWEECSKNDYQVIDDYFSDQIPLWQKHLQPLIKQEGGAALVIGSQQGIIPCWLLDKVLTHMSDELFCVDQAFSKAFDQNINQTSGLEKIVCLEGQPLSLLPELPSDCFDLIVVQERRRKADYTQQEMDLCWPLLKTGGVVIVQEYSWEHPGGPQHSPKAGVDSFLKTIKGQFDILSQEHQLIFKKKALSVVFSPLRGGKALF
ncbi:MAG: tetratricopeptide repeat protein [Cyanobacteria bacterium P01_F01_bin.150]